MNGPWIVGCILMLNAVWWQLREIHSYNFVIWNYVYARAANLIWCCVPISFDGACSQDKGTMLYDWRWSGIHTNARARIITLWHWRISRFWCPRGWLRVSCGVDAVVWRRVSSGSYENNQSAVIWWPVIKVMSPLPWSHYIAPYKSLYALWESWDYIYGFSNRS